MQPETKQPEPIKIDFTHEIKTMAYVMGMSKEAIEEDIRKGYEGPELEIALRQLNDVFGDKNKINRKLVRFNRKKNKVSFTKALKDALKDNSKPSHPTPESVIASAKEDPLI